MLKAIVVDDEADAVEELVYVINKCRPETKIAGQYTSPLSALNEFQSTLPNVAFIDIEMPGLNGFALAEELLSLDKNISLVFVTAYDEYAVQAFEIHAADYILKPFAEERIHKCLKRIQKIQERANESNVSVGLQEEIRRQSQMRGIKKIPLWQNDRIFVVNPDEVCYVVQEKGESKLTVWANGQRYNCPDKISVLQEKLDKPVFFRCHRNYIVNLDLIEEVLPSFNHTYLLKIKGCEEKVPVSRHYLKEFKEVLQL